MSFFTKDPKKELDKLQRLEKEHQQKQKALEDMQKIQAKHDREKEKKKLEKLQSKSKPYNRLKRKGMFDMGWYGRMFRSFFSKPMYIVVLMFLEKGGIEEFIARVEKSVFRFNGKSYVYDSDIAQPHTPTKLNICLYHESCDLPLIIDVDVDALYKKMDEANFPSIALNPATLDFYIRSEFIQKAMKGADLGNDIAFMKMIMMLNMLVSGVTLLLILNSLRG